MFAYLNDDRWGRSEDERYRAALKNNLQDMKYDDGMIKTVLTKVPVCGNIANVATKAVQGYPISKSEWVDAGVEGVDLLLKVATAGASQVATYAAAAAKAAKVASDAKKLRKIAAYANRTKKALETAKDCVGYVKHAKKAIDKFQGNSRPKSEERSNKKHMSDAVSSEWMFREGNNDHLCRVFGFDWIRGNSDCHIMLTDYDGEGREIAMPREFIQWDKVFSGKTDVNSILLVMMNE